MCIVLNTSALELATGADYDLDREFRAGGVACLVAGLGGSTPGCNANVPTLMCRAMRAERAWLSG